MKRILRVLKVFFISLYNFLVGLPEVYDVELRCLNDQKFGTNCTEFGTLWIRPFQKALYEYVLRSRDGTKEESGCLSLKLRMTPDKTLTLGPKAHPILRGKAVKADDGSFFILGPGFIKNKPLLPHEFVFFERLWDMPENI